MSAKDVDSKLHHLSEFLVRGSLSVGAASSTGFKIPRGYWDESVQYPQLSETSLADGLTLNIITSTVCAQKFARCFFTQRYPFEDSMNQALNEVPYDGFLPKEAYTSHDAILDNMWCRNRLISPDLRFPVFRETYACSAAPAWQLECLLTVRCQSS
jgi:hypothetical protein